MTDEEKKAIAIFKSYINAIETFGTIDYKCINNLYEPAITLLNLITKLQKENEKYKYLYQKALDNTIKSDRENIELKKQIDLMAEYMFNKNKAQLIIEYGIENKEQFIEKFEKLAKEKGE